MGKAEFRCDFKPIQGNIQYIVEYYQGSSLIKTARVSNENGTSGHILSEEDYGEPRYGTEISCKVSICYPDNCNDSRGEAKTSNKLYHIVYTSTEEVTVLEGGDPVMITSRNAVPPRLFCPIAERDSGDCEISLRVYIRKQKERKCFDGSEIVQAVCPYMVDNRSNNDSTVDRNSTCSYKISAMTEWKDKFYIPILAKVDGINDRDQTRSLQVQVRVSYSGKVIIYNTRRIKLKIKDSHKSSTCKSINDPHMKTFDGKKYDNFLEGEFVLYRHKTLPYEVTVFYRSCNKRAACNCAVAVRVDDDVVILDICGPTRPVTNKRRPLVKTMYVNGQLTPGFRVYRKGNGAVYLIYLPHGAFVKVKAQGKFLNIWMKSSSYDFNRVEGLCGNFDGNKNNDLMSPDGVLLDSKKKRQHAFSHSWRVPKNMTLYNGYCGTNVVQQEIAQQSGYSCDANDSLMPSCGEDNNVLDCALRRGRKKRKLTDVTDDLLSEAVFPRKCISTIQWIVFEFDLLYVAPEGSFPTKSGITYEWALGNCTQFILSTKAGGQCNTVTGVDVQATIEGCVDDIMETDDLRGWLMTALNDVTEQCTIAIESDVDLWIEGDDGETNLPETIDNICPDECNGRGKCVNEICVCDADFDGDDCSIKRSDPPTLVSIFGGPLCDRRVSDCKRVTILGFGFLSSKTLSCSYEFDDKTKKEETTVFKSQEDITCSLPAGVYKATLTCTNDGITHSGGLPFTVYNSQCQECNETICFNRTDVCRIGDFCYEDGSTDPNNSRQTCNTSVSTTSWTRLEVGAIQIRYLLFIRIEVSFLITSLYKFTLIGGPSLIPGPIGGLSLRLNGRDQAMDLGDWSHECLGDILKCQLGVTFSFKLKITSPGTKCYILNNGGDQDDSYGYAVWFSSNQMYCRLTTKTREWTVVTNKVKANRYHDVQFSWGSQYGLHLFVDGKDVVKTTKFVQRAASVFNLQKKFLFGQSISGGDFCGFDISELSVVYATKILIIEAGISTGLPAFDEEPDLEVKVKNNTVSLQCSFEPLKIKTKSYLYSITWYNDEKIITRRNLGNDTFKDELSEEMIGVVRYGSKLSCSVTACYANDCNSTVGPERHSDYLLAKIKVTSERIRVYEGGSAECLKVRSPLPPRMFFNDTNANGMFRINHHFIDAVPSTCSSGIQVPQAAFSVKAEQECYVSITNENWISDVCVQIKAVPDGLKDKNKVQTVMLTSWLYVTSIYQRVDNVNVSIDIIDQDKTATCKSINDPHMTTFDKRTYDNFFQGEFILYRHETLPYEVRIFTRSCNKRASCNCAVAVKSGDDVIVIDRCGAKDKGKRKSLVPKMFINDDLTRGTFVIRFNNGREYKIILPHGGYVTVTLSGRKKEFINVIYKAASVDFKSSQGLCGNFDDDKSNDLVMPNGNLYTGKEKRPKPFSKSWRIFELGIESIFNGICPDDLPVKVINETYCDCNYGENRNDTCTNDLDLLSCTQPLDLRKISDKKKQKKKKARFGFDVTQSLISTSSERPPKKCISTQPVIEFEYNITYVAQDFSWPTPSGITEIEAITHCKTYIERTVAFQGCKDLDIGFSLSLDSCVADLQIMDDRMWADEALKTVLKECTIQIEMNIDLWVVIGGVFQPNPVVVGNLCPGLCNGQGTCDDGVCACNTGYDGDDCSIQIVNVPVIDPIPEPFCDVRKADCRDVVVTGEGFIESTDLVCILQKVTRTTTSFVATGDKTTVEATFVSSEQVICNIPDAASYNITISNAGGNVAVDVAVLFVTFDPVCYICSDKGCQPRNNVCFIGDGCYGKGFFNPADPTQVCNPTVSKNSFVTITRTAVVEYSFTFIRITQNILVTVSANFTVVGNPKFVTGMNSNQALQLNGKDQYIDLGSRGTTCLGDLTACGYGVTVTFNLKILTFTENMYILSNGGDNANGHGVAMYYKRNRLYLTVSTTEMEWTVYTEVIKVNVFVSIKFSWSIQTGLYLYFGDTLVAHTTKYISRNVTVSQVTQFYIGRSVTTTVYANIIIEGWQVIEAVDKVTETLEAVTTTTTEPTTTEAETTTTTEMETTTISEQSTESSTTDIPSSTTSTLAPTTSTTQMKSTTLPSSTVSSTTPIGTTSTQTSASTPVETTTTTQAATVTTAQESTTTQSVSTTTTTPSTTTTGCIGDVGSSPTIDTKPTLTSSVSFDQTKVTFDCTATLSKESGADHAIWWYIGDTKEKEVTLSQGVNVNRLESTSLSKPSDILVSGISCAIVTWNTRRCGQTKSTPLKSTKLMFTMTVNENSAITIWEGHPTYFISITLSQSVSFYCALKYGTTCSFDIIGQVEKTADQQKCTDNSVIPDLVIHSGVTDPNTATCGSSISGTTLSTTLGIKAVIDQKYQKSRVRMLDVIRVEKSGSTNQQTLLKKIQVTIMDVDSQSSNSLCTSINDPHIVTFDGTAYDHFIPGEYVMYMNRKAETEVRGLFKRCEKGTCNCGAMIRSGDDVIKVDKCRLPSSTVEASWKKRIFLNNNLKQRTRILEEYEGKVLRIVLPTGTTVKIEDNQGIYVNLYINPSAADFNNTEGLCGIYDSNPDNDLTDSTGTLHKVQKFDDRPDVFSRTWQKKGSASFYREGMTTVLPDTSSIYCVCYNDGSKDCGYSRDVQLCIDSTDDITDQMVDDELSTQLVAVQVTSRRRRRKRAVPDPAFVYDDTYVAPNYNYWPQDIGISEAAARTSCEQQILQSSSAQSCTNVLHKDFKILVENCMSDVKMTGSVTWAQSAVASIKETCNAELNKNISLWETTPNAAPKLPANIVNTLCLNDCSGNGNCQNGACNCNQGYTGGDCSLSANTVPIVILEYTNTLCDVSVQTCTSVLVFGTKFMNSSQLTCHMRKILVGDTAITRTVTVTTSKAIYRSISSVICNLPTKDSYAIKISNDGSQTSAAEATFVAYRSQCYDCSVSVTANQALCKQKTTTCVIDSSCYVDGVVSASDPCLSCQPTKSLTSWTRSSDAGCKQDTINREAVEMNSTTIIAVSASVAAAFLVMIISSIIAFKCRKSRKDKNMYEKRPGFYVYDNASYGRSHAGSGNAHEYGRSYENPIGAQNMYAQTPPIAFYQPAVEDYFED